MSKSFYETLGVAPNATVEEIEKAFKQKAHKCHPDKGGSEQSFLDLIEAYEILKDPTKRKIYDQTGNVDQAKNIYDSAEETIKMLAAQIIKNFDIQKDLVEIMRKIIRSEILSSKKKINELANLIIHYSYIKNRIICKRSKNVISDLLGESIKGCESAVKTQQHRIEICKVSLVLLDDYSYQCNLPELSL